MGKSATTFDPKVFLAKVGSGRSIASYQVDQVLFSQGEMAESVFYIIDGKVKVSVVSKLGKKRWSP